MASAGQDKVKDLFATEPDYWHLKSLQSNQVKRSRR